jgi:sec-independent protein translocase protein TatC
MADEPAAEPLDEQPEEEGGPVKSFLEHLEDLRWVLIKSIAAAGVAMIFCFFAGNYVFQILRWPLDRAPLPAVGGSGQTLRVMFGTNQLAVYPITTNDPLAAVAGTNRYVRFDIVPIPLHTNDQTNAAQAMLGIRVQAETKPPPSPSAIDIVSLGPAAAFVVATKLAFYGGLVISSPFIFYFVGHFVFPALKIREKTYVSRGLVFGIGLFLTGVAFCYFVMMPVALAVSAKYAEWFGFKANQWRAEEYIGFVCKFMLGMGIGFEMPVIILTLVKIGLLNYSILKSARRYVIVIAFVLGAVLTTPEVITQVLMAVPLLFLYEISVWIAWYWERREKKREAEAEKAGT